MKSIGALVGVGIAGLFVGALATELIRRTNPNFLKDIGASTKRAFQVVGEAFKEGYHGEQAAKAKSKSGD